MPSPSWDFEAFRAFVPYEVMRRAANVLLLFEGSSLEDQLAMERLTEALVARTGKSAWLPQRAESEVETSDERNIFRNKARLLASIFICNLPRLQEAQGSAKTVELLPFGRALAQGRVSNDDYYEFIVTRYRYPHPAFSSYDDWVATGRRVAPFVFMFQVLIALHDGDPAEAYLTKNEMVQVLMEVADHDRVDDAVQMILERRASGTPWPNVEDIRSRKATDLLGFLAISGFAYYDDDRVRLNLLGIHPEEKSHFWKRRAALEVTADKLVELNALIDEALGGLNA